MSSKSAGDIIAAVKKGFVAVGGEPKLLHCDADSGTLATETRKALCQ